jgi:hypothetical protein
MTGVVRLLAGVVGAVGLVIALGAGYLVVRGPFLGGPTLAPRGLVATLGAFVVGIAVAAWGTTRYARL